MSSITACITIWKLDKKKPWSLSHGPRVTLCQPDLQPGLERFGAPTGGAAL